ncbi:MAG: peptidyl-prolyl cis-trans isomerase [Candidatus Coatesbacteria bacterium]|nr:peptidyl-prolyl cis-trans isomerase [Candidatus Coatesbacteria bacterium]
MNNMNHSVLSRLLILSISVSLLVTVIPFVAHGEEAAKKEDDKESKVLARVGDEVLLLSEFNSSLELMQLGENEEMTLEKKQALVENWVLTQLMAAEALKRGYADREEVKSRIAKSRAKILSESLLSEELSKITATDEDVAAFYGAHKDLFTIPETISLGIITLKTQEQAEAALKRISGGEEFSQVAKDVSIDKYRDEGGKMGSVAKSEKLPEFIRAAFYLQEGGHSDVIKYKDDYCILKVFSKSPPKTLSLGELGEKLKAAVKKHALREMRAKAIQELEKDLEKKTTVKRNLALLGEE